MRTAAFAAAALAATAGCSWTLEHDGGWLPLVGDAPSLADEPRYAGRAEVAYYEAGDGRVWVKRREAAAMPDGMGELVLRALDLAAEERRFPPQAYLVHEGVVVTDELPSSDPTRSRLRLTLDRLGAGPTVTRDVSVPAAGALHPVVRGPGFFVVAQPGGDDRGSNDSRAPLLVVSDDGSDDTIAAGPERWDVSPAKVPRPGAVDQQFEGSARFIIVHGDGAALAAYDRQTRTLLRAEPLPQLPIEAPSSRFVAPPPYVYDDMQERLWFCGVETATLSLVTGERRTFPFGCIDLRHQRGAELLVQAPGGAVYALGADGSAVSPLGTCPPYGIYDARGRAFLYVRDPGGEQLGPVFSGWIGDRHVVRRGMSPRFSADGRRLYWLEDVAFQTGDLLSFDLATHTVRHLVRNVAQFDELADGRLAAIANAAFDGPFNRAVLVDERAGESRWLAANAQSLERVGEALIVTRQNTSTVESYRVAVPAPPPTAP